MTHLVPPQSFMWSINLNVFIFTSNQMDLNSKSVPLGENGPLRMCPLQGNMVALETSSWAFSFLYVKGNSLYQKLSAF